MAIPSPTSTNHSVLHSTKRSKVVAWYTPYQIYQPPSSRVQGTLGISVMLADIIRFPSLKVIYMPRCDVNDKYGQILQLISRNGGISGSARVSCAEWRNSVTVHQLRMSQRRYRMAWESNTARPSRFEEGVVTTLNFCLTFQQLSFQAPFFESNFKSIGAKQFQAPYRKTKITECIDWIRISWLPRFHMYYEE